MLIRFTPNEKGNPPGKLADAELHFTADDGPLAGLKLIGFGLWERRAGGAGAVNVTFPARQYSINGERRSFALLRPIVDVTAQERIRQAIIDAWQDYQARANGTDCTGTVPPQTAGQVHTATRGAAGRSLDESHFGEPSPLDRF